MGISRVIQALNDTTGNLTMDLTDINAQGVVCEFSTAGATVFQLTEIFSAGGPTITRARRILSGGPGLWRDQYMGFPVSGTTLTFTWNAGQFCTYRFTFFQEPIRPFGVVPIFEGTANLAAGLDGVPVSGQDIGAYKHAFLDVRMDRPGTIRVVNASGALTLGEPQLMISGQNGGTGHFGPFPISPRIDVVWSNHDNQNTLSILAALRGVLG